MRKRICVLAAAAALLASPLNVNADGIVDCNRGANYGAAVAVQLAQTGFGDNDGTNPGSELDAAYAYCANDRLYMIMTGNLEQNFNKLNIFFDTKAGGENILSAAPDYDFNGGGGWTSSNWGGMTFDAGFDADYHMFARSGGGDDYQVDFIDRLGGATLVNGNTGNAVGAGTITSGSLANNAAGSAINNDINFFFDNSNTAGVLGNQGTAAAPGVAEAVATGFEFSIALADLGITDSSVPNTIRVAAMIGNADHNFLSNQILSSLDGTTTNLGGDGAGGFTGDLAGVDFNQFAGTQFMTITLPGHTVPEPSSLALLGLGSLVFVKRRRQS